MKELWEEADPEEWNAQVDGPLIRLHHSHRVQAKTLDEKLDNLDEFAALVFGGTVSVDQLAAEYTRTELLEFLERSIGELRLMVMGMSPEQLVIPLPGAPTGPDESGDETHFDASEIITHVSSGLTFHRWHIARALGHERPEGVKPPEGTTMTGKRGTPWAGEAGAA